MVSLRCSKFVLSFMFACALLVHTDEKNGEKNAYGSLSNSAHVSIRHSLAKLVDSCAHR